MKPYKVLLFILICLAGLLGISFVMPEGGIKLTDTLTFKYPTAEEIFHPQKVELKNLEEIAQNRADSIDYALKLSDSLSFSDSLAIYESFDNNNPAKLYYYKNDKSLFYAFFAYLDSLKQLDTSAHVLHYGDSQIEMDRITGYLREEFQKKWGGHGVGFITPRPLAPTYNIAHQHSPNWRRQVPFGPVSMRAKHYRYGPFMTVSNLDSGSSGFVRITARKNSTIGVRKFDRIRLMYRGQISVSVKGSNGDVSVHEDSYPNLLKMKTWDFDTFQRSASFNIIGDSVSEIYGMSLESKVGIHFSNIPMRGASGTFFTSVDSTIMYHGLAAINTRLIIMEFGGNMMPVMNSKSKAIWYGKKMADQVRRLKNTRPEATILFIGPADMTEYSNGVPQTHKYLEIVIKELKKSVVEAGAIYWDMYEAMGGKNSMQVWYNNSPRLASSDGIHYTKRGAQKISKMLWETILNDYKIYKMKKRLEGLEL